jgi:hypothetical protein
MLVRSVIKELSIRSDGIATIIPVIIVEKPGVLKRG